MGSNLSGINSLSYRGVEASSPPNLVKISRAPTSGDIKNFKLGDMWLHVGANNTYMLTDKSEGIATWTAMATSTAGLQTMVSDSGTATVTGTAMNVLGGELINTAGVGDTLTVNVDRGTNGQLMIGSTGAAGAWANLASSGGTVTITEGANTINLEASGSVALQFDGDSGSATPTAGVMTITGGDNITTSAATNVVTVAVSGTTDHGVQVGNASASLTSLAVGTTGQTLTATTASDPAFAAIGTNSSLTDHGVLLGQGTAAFVASSVGSDGTVMTGNSAADPTFESIGTKSTLTANGVLLGGGASAFTAATVGTDGQVMIGATAGAPVFATLTSTGATITFTPGTNTLNMESVGGGGTGLTWSEVTGTSQALAVLNGYVLNNAGLVTATLPATAAVGEVIAIVGKGTGGWKIAQNASQTIHLNSSDTTTGVGGSLASTVRYNAVEVVCTTANTDFVVRSSMGNITVV